MKDYLRSAKRSITRTIRESITSEDPALEQKLKSSLTRQGFSSFVGQVETKARDILKRARFDTEEAAKEWLLSVEVLDRKDLDKGTIARRDDVRAVLRGLSRLREVQELSRGNEKAELAAWIMGLAVADIESAEAHPHLLQTIVMTKAGRKSVEGKGKHFQYLRYRNKEIQAEADDIRIRKPHLSERGVAELIRKRSLKQNKETLSVDRIRKIIKCNSHELR